MTTVNVHEAKTHFSRLLERARRGERITIAKAGVPVAVLAPLEPEPPLQRTPGSDKGRIWISDDFDAPLPGFDGFEDHPEDPLRESTE